MIEQGIDALQSESSCLYSISSQVKSGSDCNFNVPKNVDLSDRRRNFRQQTITVNRNSEYHAELLRQLVFDHKVAFKS